MTEEDLKNFKSRDSKALCLHLNNQGILFRRCIKGQAYFDAYVKRLGVHGDERVLLKFQREGRYLIYFVEGADDHGKHRDIPYPVNSKQRKPASRMP
jgi:hypothetical protein